MKVLYIVSTLKRTGPTNQLFNIVKNLDAVNFDCAIITLSPEPQDSMLQEFLRHGLTVKSLNLTRVKGVFIAGRKIQNEISKLDPDIIHTQGIRADEIAVNYLKDFKVVSTIRNYPFEDYVMKFGRIKGYLMAKKHFKVIKKSIKPILCSYTLKEKFLNEHGLEIDVIQNGVDTFQFKKASLVEKARLRKKFGISQDKRVFISVGSFIKRKSPELIINEFLRLSEEENCILIMVGDGNLLEKCKEAAKGRNDIIFTGSTSDVGDYLRLSDFYITASKSEGLPNTVLESLATEVPVLLSNIGPHKEILNYNSKAGYLFTENNLSKLLKKLNKLTGDEYTAMQKAAANIIKENLSGKAMSNKYQALYKRMVRDS
ncbi:glycosyltransferase family 4 protein [Virgibacillus sp. Bac330]|uniref:glycosyltransferase family 4 protein n=1 Tax=Virgibacillus sp. Bac330 TaxID=2419841 RepID=UPI0013CF0278|nr:glycosyltransferase family 4 protein [Virgibacillus sp. Bac330]